MNVLCLAGTKGGTGKSTLAAALAVEASRKSRAAVLDLDAQQSLARWHELRVGEIGAADRPALLVAGRHPDRAIAKARENGLDWLVIDCPPGSIRHTAAGIGEADLVLIPARPSPLDVEAIGVMADLCKEHGRDFAFVLNATTQRDREMTAGARQYLAQFGDVLDIEVTNRVPYADAMGYGATGAENDKAAAAEIAALWLATTKRLASGRKLAKKKGLA
jgi:chromosome partitioning protein